MLNRLVSLMLPAIPRPIVHRVAGRYIAGDDADAAIALAGRLGERGFVTTLDVLGEDTETWDQARAAAETYADLTRRMAAAGIERNISIKLSQLGLRLDHDRAFDELRRVLDAAAEGDFFVRIDMEDATVTDDTIELYRRAREVWPRTGTVLQSRLKRTVRDARELAAEGADLRLCKGIYLEAPEIAHTEMASINRSYLESARAMLERGAYVGFATHDLPLIEGVERLVAETGASVRDHEFQALLGVPIRTELERLRDAGNRVRLYIPFGEQWYAYSVRRLKENPSMAGAITRSLFSRDRMDSAALH